MELKDKKILVVGLARTGVAVARFLAEQGALVTVTDMKGSALLGPYLQKLADMEKIVYELGYHEEATFIGADMVVMSPGVPMEIPPVRLAREAGCPVLSEIELASIFIDVPVAAITGTNGKTTTTTLAGEIFKSCGFKTFVGGNIGKPLIDLVTSGERVDLAVAEISSFQLEGISSFCPKVAVLLNLTEDHLDRYESFQEYINAKARIFENQTTEDFAVLNMDDPLVATYAASLKARVVPMSRLRELDQGIFHRDGCITFIWEGRTERFPTDAYKLRGVHNIENIMAALAVALLMGCDAGKAAGAVERFSALRHRMELVRVLNDVAYYNDSKGTNVGSVVKSLESFAGKVTLIAGGKDKGGEYAPLADLVKNRVSHLILLGEARQRIYSALGNLTDTCMVGSLEEAVARAGEVTEPGGVVLFSPACSSFDMFRNYEERGDLFATLVDALPGSVQ
ncbi:MAG: UDP-N-acetylmuramoyl-L-alanine--D-glutamate ligase [Deltaproteobacteria bacterium]|jgi:UDP-N-acetylmuramoylalanine--D-glutamate ligase